MGGGTGNSLTINGGTIAANAGRTFTDKYPGGITIGGDFTFGSATAPAVATSNLAFNNNVSLSSSRIITIGGTGNYTFSGSISGASSALTVNSTAAGTLILSGANTFDGGLTVNGGTVQLNNTSGALPASSNVVINGGTLRISANQTLNNLTLTTGTLTVDAGVTLTINGTLTVTDGTVSNSGTYVYGVGSTLLYNGTTLRNTSAELPTTPSTVYNLHLLQLFPDIIHSAQDRCPKTFPGSPTGTEKSNACLPVDLTENILPTSRPYQAASFTHPTITQTTLKLFL
jgi:autotransporter-associated beta strand protein/adhesin HecA-like repeat protein